MIPDSIPFWAAEEDKHYRYSTDFILQILRLNIEWVHPKGEYCFLLNFHGRVLLVGSCRDSLYNERLGLPHPGHKFKPLNSREERGVKNVRNSPGNNKIRKAREGRGAPCAIGEISLQPVEDPISKQEDIPCRNCSPWRGPLWEEQGAAEAKYYRLTITSHNNYYGLTVDKM